MTVGFATTLLAMGLQRSFVLDPFLASGERTEQRAGACAVLTLSLLAGSLAGAACGGVGALLDGAAGAGLRAFSPVLVPVLAQDALRTAAYRADRTGDAAAARALWFVATSLLFLARLSHSADAVAVAWGAGAGLAALLLAWRLQVRPADPIAAARLWRSELRGLGVPLGAAGLIYGAASQIEVYVASSVAGAGALGGFRAAVSAFAPLTVLRPALGQVGLPRVAREMERDARAAARRAALISAVLLAASLAYAGAAAAYGRLLPVLFGASFEQYSGLLLPVTVNQVLSAAGTGVHLYLLAGERGAVVFAGTVLAAPLRLAATAFLGARFGAAGLAWAVVIGAGASLAVGAAAAVEDLRRWTALRPPFRARAQGAR
ncbi:MAG: hypothetical protein QN172_11370 [Armatimonadota bacterium]|nr:hypothetical protein [Armatimonadota bacterium]